MESGLIAKWSNFRPPLSPCSFFRRVNNFPTTSTSSSSISIGGIPPFSCIPTTFHVLRCSQQAQFGKDNAGGHRILTSDSALTWGKGLLNFARANFLPIALIGAVALGMICPTLGCQASRYSILNFSTFGIFFISGLKLNDGEVGEIIKAWPAVIYGLASILLFCPLLSRVILKVQLMPQEFSTGLAIFSCMPTTLTSGVALTQIVGGNSGLALALTVISNTLGILVVSLRFPFLHHAKLKFMHSNHREFLAHALFSLLFFKVERKLSTPLKFMFHLNILMNVQFQIHPVWILQEHQLVVDCCTNTLWLFFVIAY